MADLPHDHHCPWREEAERLAARVAELEVRLAEQRAEFEARLAEKTAEVEELAGKLAALTTAMEALERRILGPKSEKVTPPDKELRHKEPSRPRTRRRVASPLSRDDGSERRYAPSSAPRR